MKPKTLILMVVAVVCGLGASYMTSRLLADREPAPEVVEVQKVTLLVAKRNLEMHVAFKKKPEDFFVEKQFVKDDSPKDAMAPEEMAKLKDKYLKRSLRKGDHITAEDLIDSPMGLRTLPPGMRAIGIRVTNDTTASGFANVPGSHVDIIWTKRNNSELESFSKVLLEDVIVLAADTNTESPNGGAAMIANVVTVALNQEDALRVSLAMDNGSLRLVVRNMEDKSAVSKERITLDSLVKGTETTKKAPEPQAPEIPDAGRADTYADRGVREELPPKVAVAPPEPEPKSVLKKMTASVRNGPDVVLHHYWLDESGRVILSRQDLDDQVLPPEPKVNGNKKTPY
jgi:pilus assembly protein CpaB